MKLLRTVVKLSPSPASFGRRTAVDHRDDIVPIISLYVHMHTHTARTVHTRTRTQGGDSYQQLQLLAHYLLSPQCTHAHTHKVVINDYPPHGLLATANNAS